MRRVIIFSFGWFNSVNLLDKHEKVKDVVPDEVEEKVVKK